MRLRRVAQHARSLGVTLQVRVANICDITYICDMYMRCRAVTVGPMRKPALAAFLPRCTYVDISTGVKRHGCTGRNAANAGCRMGPTVTWAFQLTERSDLNDIHQILRVLWFTYDYRSIRPRPPRALLDRADARPPHAAPVPRLPPLPSPPSPSTPLNDPYPPEIDPHEGPRLSPRHDT